MKEISKKLTSLAQLDIDAFFGYEEAIKEVDDPTIRDQLTRFREDHRRHVDELSKAIASFGDTPPEFSPDFKGFITAGFTAIRSQTGTMGALMALKSNEELSNKTYSEAISWDMPVDVKSIVEKNYGDEQRHLKYIQDRLETLTTVSR
ncbi:MAG: ferritin-like domain-containing protein [wastewater metagenome]|nr:ferritin-like domain-containing protein [Candidatus Loosdrechtia aerotolerans]